MSDDRQDAREWLRRQLDWEARVRAALDRSERRRRKATRHPSKEPKLRPLPERPAPKRRHPRGHDS